MISAELAACVQINLSNLAKMVPGLAGHPIFLILKEQTDTLVKQLEEELEEK